MKEGNNEKIHGTGTIGLIAAKFALEGPIIKDKMSFLISGRRTYIDLLAAPFIRIANQNAYDEDFSFGYYFYDLTTKLNYKFNDKHRLYLSAYMGNDKAYTKNINIPMAIIIRVMILICNGAILLQHYVGIG